MDLSAVAAALQASALANSIRDSLYLFALIESLHVISISLVVGTVLVIDLRLLGLASTRRPFTAVAADVLKWTWAAFVLAAISGALMFVTNASMYYVNPYFWAKMGLLVLAGLNMLVFELTARRQVAQWDRNTAAPASGRAVAAASLAIWIGVIFLGRWIGFTISSQPAPPVSEQELEGLEDLLK